MLAIEDQYAGTGILSQIRSTKPEKKQIVKVEDIERLREQDKKDEEPELPYKSAPLDYNNPHINSEAANAALSNINESQPPQDRDD